MELPNFGDFLNSISEKDAEGFKQAFDHSLQEGVSAAQTDLTLRILSAYHEWLSKSLQKNK